MVATFNNSHQSNRHVLLTGGTGLVGTAVGQMLVGNGWDVIVVSRNPEAASLRCPYPAQHVSWDQVKAANVPSVDTVVHLAGESVASGLWTKAQRERILSSRVQSAKTLVKLFRSQEKWPSVWINASAVGFYGDRGDELLTEESAKGTGFLSDVTQAWEEALLEIPETVRVVKLRFGVVLAPRGGALRAMLPVMRLGLGGVLGDGKQALSWVHIDDVVQLVKFAMVHSQVHGVYNAVAPGVVSNAAFTKALSRVLRRPLLFPAPKFLLKCLGDFSSVFLGSQNVSSEKIQSLGFKFEFQNIDRALSNLLDYQFRWGVHEQFQEQWIPKKIPEVFPFFCNETNLERLTPPLIEFKVQGKSTPQVAEGTLIDYKLKIHGLPVQWRTKILEWKPNEKFIDTQLSGPYKLWHHTHEFIDLGGGTLLRDRVLFKLPLWPLGGFMLPLIKADVAKIFAFRRQVIRQLFGP
ncbi:MAG: TIGR01777 family oxidoreductase [Proteobacteria bacterium]|nr:TIGR01777 family oxidoreductase [Pseudomonadota bacterium]